MQLINQNCACGSGSARRRYTTGTDY